MMNKISLFILLSVFLVSCSNSENTYKSNLHKVKLDKGAVKFSIMMPKDFQMNDKYNHSEFCFIGDCYAGLEDEGYLNLSYSSFEQHKKDSSRYMVFCLDYESCKLLEYKTLIIDKVEYLLTFYSFTLNNKKYYGCISHRVLNQNSLVEFRYTSINGKNFVRSEERRVGKECRSRWSRDH